MKEKLKLIGRYATLNRKTLYFEKGKEVLITDIDFEDSLGARGEWYLVEILNEVDRATDKYEEWMFRDMFDLKEEETWSN